MQNSLGTSASMPPTWFAMKMINFYSYIYIYNVYIYIYMIFFIHLFIYSYVIFIYKYIYIHTYIYICVCVCANPLLPSCPHPPISREVEGIFGGVWVCVL